MGGFPPLRAGCSRVRKGPAVAGSSAGSPPMKYHYSDSFSTYSVIRGRGATLLGWSSSDFRVQAVGGEEKTAGACPLTGPASVNCNNPLPPRPSAADRDPCRGHNQMGSLTGAVHLSNDNAGVPRSAQRGQKPRVEHKGKCWLDLDFQYEYGLRKQGLTILLTFYEF